MKKGNIAIFIPHVGCPNKCSFCNQNEITSQSFAPTADEVRAMCEEAVSQGYNKGCELAFFGGSFTAIDRDYMISLLDISSDYVKRDEFCGIRFSTRPDKINDDLMQILKKYPITAIELGCQSTDEEVLSANDRGHSFTDIINSARIINEHNISLGVQMMTGLYKDTWEKSSKTARDLIKLKPDTVRIYPTAVLPNTKLYELYNSGFYTPPNLEESIPYVAKLIEMFENENIKVIRVGLHADEELEKRVVAGVYHPALRELCESYIFLKSAKEKLKNIDKGAVEIYVAKGALSKMIGQKRANIIALNDIGYTVKVKESDELDGRNIKIISVGR